MNRVTRILREEHGLIERAAACLDRLADETLESGEVPVETAVDLLDFFEEYANTAHQEKEERCLFPALLARGLAEQRVRELLAEHEEDRISLGAMRHDLEIAAYGNELYRDRFASLAMEYARLQRQHAEAEDLILLPLVEELLDTPTELQILEGFQEIETQFLPEPAEHYADLVARAATSLASILREDCAVLEALGV
jgi:hemerythrin-like domain-containing protein